MHILHHIPEGIATHGPVYGTWMYPYERFNSWMTRRALNWCRPEATIMETYRVMLISFHQHLCMDRQWHYNIVLDLY